MPNGDLGTINQTLRVNLEGTDQAREQLQEVGNYYEGLVDLLEDTVNIQATQEVESLRQALQETSAEMVELSQEFSTLGNSSFGEFRDSFSDMRDSFTTPTADFVRPTFQVPETSNFSMEGGFDFSEDGEVEELTSAIHQLNNSIENIESRNAFTNQEASSQMDFSSQFHNPFDDVEDDDLDIDFSGETLQNRLNLNSTTDTYNRTNEDASNVVADLGNQISDGFNTFSTEALTQMSQYYAGIDVTTPQERYTPPTKIEKAYEGNLSYVPDEAGFSTNNSYYKDLEKRYNKLQTMIDGLGDVDSELATRMTSTQAQLSERMTAVKETQAQQLEDERKERELLQQQAEDRRNQQRITQQQDMQLRRQQQQDERLNNQSLLQAERQLHADERRQKQEEREMTRLHGQAIAEDLRRSQQVTTQTSTNLRGMQSNLNTTVINLNQAVQLIGTAYGKVSQLTNFYDSYTNSNARLNFSNLGDMSNTEYQRLVSQSASDARMSYADVANNIARFSMTKGFDSNQEVIEFAEIIGKSMRVAGSDTNETSSAIRQLTQAISKGKLDGDEFRSVAENSPLLMNALSELLDTDRAGVMKASAGGQLNLDTLKEAVKMMGEEVNEAFKDMPRTFRDLKTEMQNGLGEWLTTTKNGQDFMNELFSIYQEFVDFIDSEEGKEAFQETALFFRSMAQTVGAFVHVATPLLGLVGEHATLIGSMYLAYKGVNVAMKLQLLSTTGELTRNITSMGGAFSALSTTALAFLSNPYVLAVAGIGALAYGAYKLYDGVDNEKTSDLANDFNGRDYQMLMQEGYSEDEAKQLEELYAQRNMAYNDLLYYDTGTRFALSDTHTVKSKALGNDDDYESRKEEYERYIDQIDNASYLNQLASSVEDIADSSSKTAENTGESNFIKSLQTELRQAQQVKTITQMTPNIVINIDGKNDSDLALGEKLAMILKQELQIATTS